MRIQAWSLMRISDENFVLIITEPTEGGEVATSTTFMKHELVNNEELEDVFGVNVVKAFSEGKYEIENDTIVWK